MFLKISQHSQENICVRSLFNKAAGLQACKLYNRDSNIGVFLCILQNFKKHLFWKTSANDSLWRLKAAIFTKSFILDVLQISQYTSDEIPRLMLPIYISQLKVRNIVKSLCWIEQVSAHWLVNISTLIKILDKCDSTHNLTTP